MKKFIYVLSMPKSGTHRLAYGLQRIGINEELGIGCHEIINEIPIYLRWMEKRFTSRPRMDIESAKNIWKNELIKYFEGVEGDGYFADISHYISTLYPIIESVCKDMNIETRSIFATRNFYPHRIRSYPFMIDLDPALRIDEQIFNNPSREVHYFAELSWSSDKKWKDWIAMSQFERICWHWTLHNEYFLQGIERRKIFHVEDFNTRSLEILEILYPEATKEQKEKFKNALFYKPLSPDKAGPPYTLDMTNEEKEIYYRICGPTLKKLGY